MLEGQHVEAKSRSVIDGRVIVLHGASHIKGFSEDLRYWARE